MRSIHLALGSSRQLSVFFFVVHLGALCMLLWCSLAGTLNYLWLLLLTPVVLFSWYQSLKKQAWRTANSAIKEITYLSHLNLYLIKSVDNQIKLVTLCTDSVLFFSFAFLKFKVIPPECVYRFTISAILTQIKHRLFSIPVLISREAMNQGQFRQLQVWWRNYTLHL